MSQRHDDTTSEAINLADDTTSQNPTPVEEPHIPRRRIIKRPKPPKKAKKTVKKKATKAKSKEKSPTKVLEFRNNLQPCTVTMKGVTTEPVDVKVLRKALIKHTHDINEIKRKMKEIMDLGYPPAIEERWKWVKVTVSKNVKHFVKLVSSTLELTHIYNKLYQEVRDLEKTREKYYNEIARRQEVLGRRSSEAIMSYSDERALASQIRCRQEHLLKKEKEVGRMEQDIAMKKEEIAIRQEELEVCIRETNLAKSSYYHLTDAEIELFEVDRPKILAGVEKYGSITAAVRNDGSIKSRISSIMYHAKKHKQFGQDIEMAKQVFRESLDAEIMDRAINGTKNPVFQRGEYVGEYAVKDNKLLVEVAKAKLPEQYNPRVYAQAHPPQHQGTTINIVSFDGVDETKRGYTRNVGVVTSVDESGRVERITQNKDVQKMLEFYKNKGTAEIIEASPEASTSLEKADEIIEGTICPEGGEEDVLE